MPTITADHLDRAVHLAVDLLRQAPPDAWGATAGELEWDCWETAEHLSDDLFGYATQLGPRTPPLDDQIGFSYESRRPGGPMNAVHADRRVGSDGLLQALEANGALLSAMVRTTPPQIRAHHTFGASDAAGFAAMGIVETLVHTDDLAHGLGLKWEPPAELCELVLERLFPDVSTGAAPWPSLLWATGRTELPGLARRTSWRWYGEPRG